MSPARLNHEPKMINGSRPTPLMISKESHAIKKPTTTMPSSIAPHYASKPPPTRPQQQRTQPVIIYTHSPKVIHTQARDFMALVQKLTGVSQSNNYTDIEETEEPTKSKAISSICKDGNKSSSIEQNFGGCGGENELIGSAPADYHMKDLLNPPNDNNNNNNNNKYNSNNNPYLADIPLFTPTGTDLFSSRRPPYRHDDNSSFASPGMGNLTSPSVLELLKELHEY